MPTRVPSDPGLDGLLASRDETLRGVLQKIDRNTKGIVLIVDRERRLEATITDGDVRRGILAGLSLEHSVHALLAAKCAEAPSQPVTASADATESSLVHLMQERSVRQVPLLDNQRCVVGLVTLEELLPEAWSNAQAVIMAGGFGRRLWPLTVDTPKPMLPVGNRPVMEHIVEQISQSGIRQVNVTTHYLPERIIDHFGDGAKFGVHMSYVNEDQPLGTAGALALLPPPGGPLLVVNGDVLTSVDFRSFLAFHRDNGGMITVGVRRYEFSIPYGVVECAGAAIQSIQEKPSLQVFVNAGIYVVEPAALSLIPAGQRFDMTDLISKLLAQRSRVVSYPIVEYWLDIGRQPDYQQAQDDAEHLRFTSAREQRPAA